MVNPPDDVELISRALSWRAGPWTRLTDPAPAWTGVEQDPDGVWWATVTDDTATTTAGGPYLDEVQALRALNTWDAP